MFHLTCVQPQSAMQTMLRACFRRVQRYTAAATCAIRSRRLRTMIAVDGSPSARKAFDFVVSNLFSTSREDKLLLLTVPDFPEKAVAEAIAVDSATSITGAEAFLPKIVEDVGPDKTLRCNDTTELLVARFKKAVKDKAHKLLHQYVNDCTKRGIPLASITPIVAPVSPSPKVVICEQAASEGVELLVVGSQGMNPVRRLLLGSTADYVVHHAPCPVMVVKEA